VNIFIRNSRVPRLETTALGRSVRVMQGSYQVLKSMEKSLVIFQPGKNFFGLLVWKKGINFL